jgi:CheY-like chemotaxis protein
MIAPSSSGLILLVEDTPAIRDVVQALLEGEGFAVVAISDGQRAVSWAEHHQPALVVLDLDLPVLDGVAVASILRARFGALFPILIFSADERAYAKTRHLGPCGLIRKPFDADGLVAAVRGGLKVGGRFRVSSAFPADLTGQRRSGRDMPSTNGDLATLADELQRQLDAGALDGLGPVTLLAGPFADTTLAARALLADLDHLCSLAEHSGSAPTTERWTLLADELYLLLLMLGRRRDRGTDGQNGRTPPVP